jgi:hypothetical protein
MAVHVCDIYQDKVQKRVAIRTVDHASRPINLMPEMCVSSFQ